MAGIEAQKNQRFTYRIVYVIPLSTEVVQGVLWVFDTGTIGRMGRIVQLPTVKNSDVVLTCPRRRHAHGMRPPMSSQTIHLNFPVGPRAKPFTRSKSNLVPAPNRRFNPCKTLRNSSCNSSSVFSSRTV